MKRGEIWWVEFDPAIGSEIKKTRPAVIVSNDIANKNLARVVVVPITSNVENCYPGEAIVSVHSEKGSQPAKAMSDQIMAADKSRLKGKLGKISAIDMMAIERAITIHLGIL